jgi:hypothetical protein
MYHKTYILNDCLLPPWRGPIGLYLRFFTFLVSGSYLPVVLKPRSMVSISWDMYLQAMSLDAVTSAYSCCVQFVSVQNTQKNKKIHGRAQEIKWKNTELTTSWKKHKNLSYAMREANLTLCFCVCSACVFQSTTHMWVFSVAGVGILTCWNGQSFDHVG